MARLGPVDDPQAGLGDVVDQRLGADDVGRAAAAAALGEHELDRGADAEDLRQRRLEPEPPELADETLGWVTDVVGEEQQGLSARRAAPRRRRSRRRSARRRARGSRRDRAGCGHTDVGQGRSAQAPHYPCPPCPDSSPSSSPASPSCSPRCGDDRLGVRSDARTGGHGGRDRGARRQRVPARGLRERREARGEGRRRAQGADREARQVQDLHRDGLDHLRRLRDHARRQARPDHRRLVQVPGRPEVLRRH